MQFDPSLFDVSRRSLTFFCVFEGLVILTILCSDLFDNIESHELGVRNMVYVGFFIILLAIGIVHRYLHPRVTILSLLLFKVSQLTIIVAFLMADYIFIYSPITMTVFGLEFVYYGICCLIQEMPFPGYFLEECLYENDGDGAKDVDVQEKCDYFTSIANEIVRQQEEDDGFIDDDIIFYSYDSNNIA
ncbi:unnamed protein product [Caenorhabditis bovis]|uniref:Uncharacterized protein n=1 Tax=Caenorhabditis bovis TaxID=2654633 RepID=A0A8S1F347_9PELO|nr:unnamed protein product [Caenorhabditis bovis]